MKRGLFHFSLTVPGWAAWKRWVCYVLQTDSDQTNTLFHNRLENEAMWLSISILASLGVSWLIRGSLEWPDWVRPAGPGRLQWQPVVLGPPLPPWLLHGEILPPSQILSLSQPLSISITPDDSWSIINTECESDVLSEWWPPVRALVWELRARAGVTSELWVMSAQSPLSPPHSNPIQLLTLSVSLVS